MATVTQGEPLVLSSRIEERLRRGELSPSQVEGFREFLHDVDLELLHHPIVVDNAYTRWFRDGDPDRMRQEQHPGESRVYARVLRPGLLRTGDPIELIVETAAERVRRQQPKTFRWPRDFA